MEIDIEHISKKRAVFEIAKEAVNPLMEKYPKRGTTVLEAFAPLATTEVDKYIENILWVADWLLENPPTNK
jgi:hypothetical protein